MATNPTSIAQIFDAQCEITVIFNRIVTYCARQDLNLGDNEDLKERDMLYSSILEWESRLPSQLLFKSRENTYILS